MSKYYSDMHSMDRMTADPRMDPMDRTGRAGMAGMAQQGMAGGMAGGMTGGMGGGMAGGMAGGMSTGMSAGMPGGPGAVGTGPMDHHRSQSMPGNMGPPGSQGMGPPVGGAGMMHGRSRSASRGMPGNRGPGYHSLDREGYDRDFMPREPRERSLDRDFAYSGGGYATGAAGYGTGGTGAYGRRDRSIDRRDMLDPEDGFYTGGRDPMMRDPMGPRGVISGGPMGPVGPGPGPGHGVGTRDVYLGELQSSNAELQRDLANLRKELELTNQKLGSSMHSIKTFWSPELKKERALRKEESAKYSLINDQLKLLNSENQVSHLGISMSFRIIMLEYVRLLLVGGSKPGAVVVGVLQEESSHMILLLVAGPTLLWYSCGSGSSSSSSSLHPSLSHFLSTVQYCSRGRGA